MENFYISNKDVINGVSGVLYEMHPYHNPEGLDVIIEAIQAWFKEHDPHARNEKATYHSVRFTDGDEFYKMLKELLMGIKEFTNYNISRKLKDQGVKDYNEPRNQGFRAVDRYTVETDDSRYSDFIDLDAAIRNIYSQIINLKMLGDDCFLCKYAKEYGSMEPGDEICNTCLCNRNIKYNRVSHPMSLKPKKDWTEEEKKLYSLE